MKTIMSTNTKFPISGSPSKGLYILLILFAFNLAYVIAYHIGRLSYVDMSPNYCT